MRWFKHMTATKDDEKIVELIVIGGLEAYGFYWAVIELIARQMEKESDKCSVTYPLPYLSRQLYCHHNKVTNLLSKLQVTGLMDVNKIEVDGRVNFKITCPNLLKYRDEYTAKKTKNRDNVKTISLQTQEQDTDTDTDTDTDIKQNKDNKEDVKTSSGLFEDVSKNPPRKKNQSMFEDFWQAYPKKTGKKKVAGIYERLISREEVTHDELIAGINAYKKSETVKRGFIKNPETWLNGGCWADEHAANDEESEWWGNDEIEQQIEDQLWIDDPVGMQRQQDEAMAAAAMAKKITEEKKEQARKAQEALK